ncbi:integral membrane protein [unidentified eubacterium SCB49]|nr:integral membrane protein [unidentified eubacterium SCB49]
MNKTFSQILKIAIPLGLGIFLIWYIFSDFTDTQVEDLKSYFRNANYGYVIIAVSLSIFSHISRAYRWLFMLEPLGYKPKLTNNFMSIAVAYLMNLGIPKSGEITRGVLLSRYEGVPFDKGFGTIISERVVDLIFLLAFTLLAIFLKYDILFAYVTELIPIKKLLILGVVGVVLLIVGYVLLRYLKFGFISKIKTFISGLKDGVLSIWTMKKKGAFVFHTFLIWGLYILSFYSATLALEQTSDIAFSTLIITFVVGSFTFAFTNSGFGTYPAAVAGVLSLFAINFTVGTAFGWIVWASNIAAILLIGITSLVALPIYNKAKISK